jgi:hypothetical protein
MSNATRINVDKAFLPLIGNESLCSFSQRLTTDVRAYVHEKLGLDRQKSYLWISDIFADSLVVEIDQEGDLGGSSRLYQLAWASRGEGAGFTFGDLVRVRRKVTYVPVVDRPVTKSADFWRGVIC